MIADSNSSAQGKQLQLGFVIDHTRCIGCHACTVACKSENDVPLGNFRTWVKYTETGQFPDVRRSFAVLRCNQCTDAPCVTICPVKALDKRPDGIVDLDQRACIGCKACMQACPYDALYLNESKGTAEKCHFCAHRTEIGLAPACAVVCPTEAIVPGDFHDPNSAVSKLRDAHELSARKVEAGTKPNVLYREVDEAGIDPLRTDATAGYLWSNRIPGVDPQSEAFLAAEQHSTERARTTYDVDHPSRWGFMVSAYLFTKSLSSGLTLALALLLTPALAGLAGFDGTIEALGRTAVLGLSWGAVLFLAITAALLVGDLKRPERFLYILMRPNWSSWLARGSVILGAYGAVVTLLAALVAMDRLTASLTTPLLVSGAVLAALTACYTGWLFAQAKGRVLWMRRGLWLHLIVQAMIAGAGAALLVGPLLQLPDAATRLLRAAALIAFALHLLFVVTEGRMAPRGREDEYGRVHRLITRGPFAAKHHGLGMGMGIAVPVIVLLVPLPALWPWAGLAALIGLYVEEEIMVRAGQAPSIS